MIPTLILYALTIWQLGQFNPPNAGPPFHTVVLPGPTTEVRICGCAPGSEAWGCCAPQQLTGTIPCCSQVKNPYVACMVDLQPQFVPFDVPPVDGPPGTETLIFYLDCAAHGLAQMAPGVCLQPPKVCADKWRFLLQSADGKFHCVALNPR